jgi:hypothetical protein
MNVFATVSFCPTATSKDTREVTVYKGPATIVEGRALPCTYVELALMSVDERDRLTTCIVDDTLEAITDPLSHGSPALYCVGGCGQLMHAAGTWRASTLARRRLLLTSAGGWNGLDKCVSASRLTYMHCDGAACIQAVRAQAKRLTREIRDDHANNEEFVHTRRCGRCGVPDAPGTPHKRCGRCRVVPYCSGDCQHADWAQHKAVCVAPAHSVLN